MATKRTRITVSEALELIGKYHGDRYGDQTINAGLEMKRKDINHIQDTEGVLFPEMYKVQHGWYSFNEPEAVQAPAAEVTHVSGEIPAVSNTGSEPQEQAPVEDAGAKIAFHLTNNGTKRAKDTLPSLVPKKNKNFVRFGSYGDLNKILKSGKFFPVFITGLAGNGKSMAVGQACAANNREIVRLQINEETDENELLGGFQLVNGETIWFDGPVITAMRRGAVLLLDELVAGDPNRLMCLQSVLEGSSVYLKKINEMVEPAPGFQVVATANTKGNGEDTYGKFVSNNTLDAAMLDRLPIWINWDYPNARAEKKILSNHAQEFSADLDDEKLDNLITWAGHNRKLFKQDGIDDVITTRRLCYVIQAFSIFNNLERSIKYAINCFDTETSDSLLTLWKSVTKGEIEGEKEGEEQTEDNAEKVDPGIPANRQHYYPSGRGL